MTTAELESLREQVAKAWAAAEVAAKADPRTYSPSALWRAEALEAQLRDAERAAAGATVRAACSTCNEPDDCRACAYGVLVCEHCDFGADAPRCRTCARGRAA